MSRPTKDPPRTATPEIVVGAPGDRAPATIAQPVEETDHGLPDDVLTEESVRAIVSSIERAGRWYPAHEIHVRAIAGVVKLDFTSAVLPPDGVVELDIHVIAGDVEITVPDDADVELNATPFAGSVEQKRRSRSPGERIRTAVTGNAAPKRAEKPLIRVEGRAIFSTIRVNGL